MNGRPPALSDVARRAGVSHQTVSRVLNHHPHVAEPTRLRVQQAIAELGYRRNMSARVLATGQSDALGVIALNSTLYGPSATVSALSTAAAGRDMTLTVQHIQEFDEPVVRAAVDRLVSHGVAALLVILPVRSAAQLLARVVPGSLRVVTVDGPPGGANVSVDQYAGGVLATQHLLDQGHPTVWHVAGPEEWNDSRAREQGWRDTLTAVGADQPPVLRGDWSPVSGYEAGLLLARVPECRAVFAANDHMALGVARALAERGRRVPQDVALVGFDDLPESAYFFPPLTTVHQDFAEVGRQSLDLLLHPHDGTDPLLPVLIPPRLVRRTSSG